MPNDQWVITGDMTDIACVFAGSHLERSFFAEIARFSVIQSTSYYPFLHRYQVLSARTEISMFEGDDRL